jgi:hypothetical protein
VIVVLNLFYPNPNPGHYIACSIFCDLTAVGSVLTFFLVDLFRLIIYLLIACRYPCSSYFFSNNGYQ